MKVLFFRSIYHTKKHEGPEDILENISQDHRVFYFLLFIFGCGFHVFGIFCLVIHAE